MTHLLDLDASPRCDRLVSRMHGEEYIKQWLAARPTDTVTYRDLCHNWVSHVTET